VTEDNTEKLIYCS